MALGSNPLVRSLLDMRGNARACVYTEPLWGLSFMLVLPYASVFKLAVGLDDAQIGLLATISMLAQVVYGLLSGPLTDKFGRRLTTAVFDVIAWVVPCLIWAFAQNFWWFLAAALVNGAWLVSGNAWTCLLVEDAEREELTPIFSLVQVATEFSALFAPIAAVLVAQWGLEPAARILYVNAAFIMTVKLVVLFRWSTETRTGRDRMAATRDISLWRMLADYRGVVGLIIASKGMLLALGVSAIVAAVSLVTNTFWQVLVSRRLGVPDPLLPFFPMARSVLTVVFFFTVIPALTHAKHLQRPTHWGFVTYLAGQLLVAIIPASQTASWSTYAFLALCLALDAFGAGILMMLSQALVALHVDETERSRIMAIQRTGVLLLAAPFGWLSGWLSSLDRSWPFLLTTALLALGVLLTQRAWVATHAEPVLVD